MQALRNNSRPKVVEEPVSTVNLDQDSESAIQELLVGRRIINAYIDKQRNGIFVLDNGILIVAEGNEGCWGCSSGWYEVAKVSTCDNIITNVRLHNEPDEEAFDDTAGIYEIYVVADNAEINILKFTGSDGNGWYGTGYTLRVTIPGDTDALS